LISLYGQSNANHDIVETVAFAVSVLVVTYTVQDGKSNYLEGAMLLGLYIIIAVAFYATPGDLLDKATNLITSSS
jgi:Ca2+:H+ antiporter